MPWPGTAEQQLARLRRELDEMVARDALPIADDICWFSRPG